MLKQVVYSSFSMIGGDRLVWQLGPKRLRILVYHGVCEDALADGPWIPEYFVRQSALERQLQYLQENACVLPLSEAVARLRNGALPPRCVSITFDDGYANNLSLAYPLLRKYQMPATIFLSSAYMETGEIFPFLKLKLLRLHGKANTEIPVGSMPNYKLSPLQQVMAWADQWWPTVKNELSETQVQTLRPLTVEEVRSANLDLLEFGAHTDTHCILNNENAERRRREICDSVRKVSEWTGRRVRLFSYPNGERGDFDDKDKQALRDSGIWAAVSGIGGANGVQSDPLELRRYPVSIDHDETRFLAEVSGFRNALLSVGGRLWA